MLKITGRKGCYEIGGGIKNEKIISFISYINVF
jgi:hypothetical protein